MAKLSVSATLISQTLFRGSDVCPVICGASWDQLNECVVLDLIGKGVPETEGHIVAKMTQQPSLLVEFKEVP